MMKKSFLIFLLGGVLGGLGVFYKSSLIPSLPSSFQELDQPFTFVPTTLHSVEAPLPQMKGGKGVFHPVTWTLKNGLQVVVITNKRAPVVRQTVYYKVGAIDDPLGKSGIAHFLEHLMFLGGTSVTGPKELDKKIDRLGVNKNAYTTYDFTAYYMEAPKEKLAEIMEIEAGRMASLKLTDALVLPERDVILEERNMRTDTAPSAILAEATGRVLFQNHPYGRPVIGWRHEMEGLTLQDAEAFHYHWYCPNNAILIFAGDVSAETVKPLVDKYYGKMVARPIKKRTLLKEPLERATARTLKKKDPRVQQACFERIYKLSSLSYGKARDVFPLRVAAYILNAGQNSRLYQYFVKEKKVAAGAFFSVVDDCLGPGTGRFVLFPAPGKTNDDVKQALDTFIEDLLAKGISSEEVSKAKRRLLNTFAYVRDAVFGGEEEIGATLARGRSLEEIESMPSYLEAVTLDEVNSVLKNLLTRNDYVTAELLPMSLSSPSAGKDKS